MTTYEEKVQAEKERIDDWVQKFIETDLPDDMNGRLNILSLKSSAISLIKKQWIRFEDVFGKNKDLYEQSLESDDSAMIEEIFRVALLESVVATSEQFEKLVKRVSEVEGCDEIASLVCEWQEKILEGVSK